VQDKLKVGLDFIIISQSDINIVLIEASLLHEEPPPIQDEHLAKAKKVQIHSILPHHIYLSQQIQVDTKEYLRSLEEKIKQDDWGALKAESNASDENS
jgi:hypothetical protein